MDPKPPPVCKAFLLCKSIVGDVLTLLGQANCHVARQFPSSCTIAYFARLKGGHGPTTIELQLQNEEGEVVWRDGPAGQWVPASPLQAVEISLNVLPVFPRPGAYDLVLTANGEEVGREPFAAREAK
jgi:hypothetical protein